MPSADKMLSACSFTSGSILAYKLADFAVIKNNMLLEQAKEMLMLAKQEVYSAQYAAYKSTQIKNTAVSVKHLRKISDRTTLQSADNAEKFITTSRTKRREEEI